MAEARTHRNLIELPVPSAGLFKKTLFNYCVSPSLNRLLCLPTINRLYSNVADVTDTDRFLEETLQTLNVSVNIDPADLGKIPATGPVVVVANHPFGAVEGVILAAALRKVRPDAKLMANFMLSLIPQMKDCIISVDPFGSGESAKRNIGALKECFRWLKNGNMLGVFPAGEVSALNLKKRVVTDREWSPTVGRIIRKTGVPVLPVYFKGSNRALFHLLGLIHPRLRTIMLPREMLKKRGGTIDMAVGNLIPANKLEGFESDEQLMEYLKLHTYVLKNRYKKTKKPLALMSSQTLEPLAEETDPELVREDINNLGPDNLLVESGEFKVFIARKDEIPNAMRELGRLRELTFREVGEGTGLPSDTDKFDEYYLHLLLWSEKEREIAGAYRLGQSDVILEKYGSEGFYVDSLFKMKKSFVDRVHPGLEMGRSFVQKKYQRNFSSLLLLWKGIGRFVSRNPQYSVLFGPVSISNDYHTFSRELMMRFLSLHMGSSMKKTVKPKTPPKLKPLPLASLEINTARTVCRNVDDLAALISGVETDAKGIPVLLRQYLKLGGKLLAFNVDQDFCDALDGLILVDLKKTDPRILARYMGKEEAQEFRTLHGLG